jgi:hypothetical protein
VLPGPKGPRDRRELAVQRLPVRMGSGRARPYNLDVRIPDIVTPPIAWQPEAAERFGIRKVELEILQQRHEAWIYVRNFQSHRSTTQWWKF